MSKSIEMLDKLLPQISELITHARNAAARTVNTLQVITNFEIGRLIVEQEQHGTERAEYGKALLEELSAALTQEFGRGFSRRNLSNMRQFYLVYRDRPQISQTASAKLSADTSNQASLAPSTQTEIWQTVSAKSEAWTLSWSHYLLLMGIEDSDERSFYEIEATTQGWSLRELKRQFDSSLYERLALSRDKEGIRELSQEGQIVTQPEQVLKDTYVLEFLGLREETNYSERELETAIIDKLEAFLLELEYE